MRHIALLLISTFTLLNWAASASAQDPTSETLGKTVTVDIRPQRLGSALIEFSHQAGVQVLMPGDLVNKLRSNGVRGEMTVEQAVAVLLNGTNLGFHEVGRNAIGIAANQNSIPSTNTAVPGAPAAVQASTSQSFRAAQAGKVSSDDAASTPTTLPPNAAEPGVLQEVVVTARRREENIQTVPIAVTALSEQTLQENNVADFGDLQHLVPSFSTGSSNFTRDGTNVSIRGQGSNTVGGAPGVVAYINDVPIPANGLGELAGGPGLFFDLENVQVLKGPQGTLFGENSVGGAILLRTARPTNEYGGHLQVGYGNYNNTEVDGALNTPIVPDKLLFRVAINADQRDGFTHLLGTADYPNGVDADDRHYLSLRGTLTFHPVAGLQNDLIATYQGYHDHGSPLILTGINPNGLLEGLYPGFTAAALQQQSLGVRTAVATDVAEVSKGNFVSINNITRIDLSDTLTFRNILGYDWSKTTVASDIDSTIFPIFDTIYQPSDTTLNQLTEEAQLQGKSFGENLDWIAGGFFLEARNPGLQLTTSNIFGAINQALSRNTTLSKAVFAQGTYKLSSLLEGLSVTGGLRYTWDNQSSVSQGAAPTDPTPAICAGAVINCSYVTNPSTRFSALTWTAGLDYQATPDTLIYFANRRGFRAGGTNATAQLPNLPNFGPEFVTDYELGVKSEWTLAGIPGRTNAALYYQDWTDIQLQADEVSAATKGFNLVTSNAGAARQWGAEFEAQLQLTRDLLVGLYFDHLDFKLIKTGADVDPDALLGELGANGKGERPPYKYGINARYNLPLAAQLGRIAMSGNWSWQATSGDIQIDTGGLIPAYGLFNLAVNWDGIAQTSFDASLFMTNVSNETYRIGGVSNVPVGLESARYGEPRMYGVRFKYRFGVER